MIIKLIPPTNKSLPPSDLLQELYNIVNNEKYLHLSPIEILGTLKLLETLIVDEIWERE